jgi:serine/threonine-protein kinase RsbW
MTWRGLGEGPALIMTSFGKESVGECLNLHSRLSDLARVPEWIERLAAQYSIPDNTQFAMNLCLEEVLSNIVRHGYSGNPDQSITIQISIPRQNFFVFNVEDNAPAFNPVVSAVPPVLSAINENPIGGQGIRLLRQFSDALEYQPTPTGNRLSIGFSSASSISDKE